MAGSRTRVLPLAALGLALLGLAALGVLPSPSGEGGDDEARGTVREVSGVRHSAPVGAPRAPGGDGGEVETMYASYYGRELEGSPTASGEPFDPEGYTAAHKSLPLGTQLRVSRGGESVRVTVNDRGPYVAGRDLDLSLAAAREIGLTGVAEAPVRVTVP